MMSQVPVAFLIMVHADPGMLFRVMQHINDPDTLYVIHVNIRTDQAPFVEAMRKWTNVHFVPDDQRKAVNWAGFSLTEAIFNAIDHAIRIRPDAERFVLISGADYPIKPLRHILQEVRRDQEIMTIAREIYHAKPGFHNSLAGSIYLGDFALFNVRTAPWVFRKIGSGINKYGPLRRAYPLKMYHGSTWWSLTREAIEFLLSKRDTPLWNWFRYSQLADEVMPHTLLMHSPRRSFIKYNQLTGIGDLDYSVGINGPTYADWRKPNPHLPRHLEESDFEEVIASESLFMRKVDSVRSRALLDKVDQFLAQAAQ